MTAHEEPAGDERPDFWDVAAAEARAVLDAFWESRGEHTVEEGVQVLLAAYALGDKEEFLALLYEAIDGSNADFSWEVLTAFKQSYVVPLSP